MWKKEEIEKEIEFQMGDYWSRQEKVIDEMEIGTEQEFKNHNDLPLARIKRIMKSDEDVRMISAEAPVLFAKACEMFILELTLKSWCHSQGMKRRTVQREDIQVRLGEIGRELNQLPSLVFQPFMLTPLAALCFAHCRTPSRVRTYLTFLSKSSTRVRAGGRSTRVCTISSHRKAAGEPGR